MARATSHLFGWPLASQQAPAGAWPFFYAGILELIASILITAGLFTRTAAFPRIAGPISAKMWRSPG